MRSACVALFLMASCHVVSGLDSFQTRGGQGGVGGAGANATATGGGTAGGGGVPSSDLVDEGLLVRYFLNEEAGAVIVSDAAPSPLNLSVIRNGMDRPEFVGAPGQRGAEWLEAGVAGQIFAISDGTKLQESLEGNTTATIETVVSITDVDSNNTRLVYFGRGVESGRFALRADAPDRPVFYMDNDELAEWNVPLGGRVVLHLVFDSNQAQDARVRLFVDGVLSTPTAASMIDAGHDIDISTDSPVAFHIGNRDNVSDSDGRSPEGVIHYVALYDVALTDAQIDQNATRLAANDDP